MQHDGEFVDQIQVAGIGERDFESAVLDLDRDEVVAEHQVDRDGMEQVVIDALFPKVYEFAAIARGDRTGVCGFLLGVH